MKFAIKDLIRINKKFHGNLTRDGSLEFALSMQNHKRYGPYKKIAFIWRAILIDHPFTDGNKRTALWVSLKFAEDNKKEPDTDKLIKSIINIAKNSIHNIDKIERMIKNGIR